MDDVELGDPRIEAFWEVAKRHARLASLPGYFGPGALESVVPPAWSFGTDAESRDLLAALLTTRSTTLTVSLDELSSVGEPPPERGTLGIVLDADGAPAALVVTASVQVTDGMVHETLDLLYPGAQEQRPRLFP